MKQKVCSAIKSGVNGLLDVSRVIHKEATEDVMKSAEDTSSSYHVTSRNIGHTTQDCL